MIMIYSIYKATNKINGKSYVGFTSNFNNRKTQHEKIANNCPKTYFHLALGKYGKDSFHWEILYFSKNKEYTWLVMEEYYIRKYNTYAKDGNGYNHSYGGYGFGKTVTPESRIKMSNAKRGVLHSPETISKIVKKNTGKKRSAEFCKSCSVLNLGRKHSEQSKVNMSNGQKLKIKIYDTIYFGWKAAADDFKVSIRTIQRWCKSGKVIYNIEE